MSSRSFRGALAITLVVGAARKDAETRGCFDDLKRRISPQVADFRKTGDVRPIIETIRAVLGEDWAPEESFRKQIELLMEDDDGQG